MEIRNESNETEKLGQEVNPHLDESECSSDGEVPAHREMAKPPKSENNSPGAVKLRSWLNKTFRVEMSDGRILLGVFLCTDRDRNIILGTCLEYLPPKAAGETDPPEEPRALGLVMVPGKHIVSIHLDQLGETEATRLPADSEEII